jgi:hypothetical protein
MPARPGDPLNIPAAKWNDVESLLAQWKAAGRQISPALGRTQPLPHGWVWVKNTSSTDITSFTVLSVFDLAVNIADNPAERFNGIRADGRAPTASIPYFFNYVVLQEPCRKNEYARAIASGLSLVKLNITHADDWYCYATVGQTGYLTTGAVGTSRISLKSTGTGSSDKYGVISVGEWGTTFVGKPNASAAVEAIDVVVNVWDTTFSGATGQQVSSCYNPSTPLVASDRVLGTVVNGTVILTKLNKSSQEVILDMRIKSGNTQIEANTATIYGDFSTSPAWEDKIELTSCPP